MAACRWVGETHCDERFGHRDYNVSVVWGAAPARSVCCLLVLPEMSEEGDALPPGWELVRHTQLARSFWVHSTTRVVSWTRPYVVDKIDATEEHEPPQAALPSKALVQALAAKQVDEWEALRKAGTHQHEAPLPQGQTPEDRLERELSTRPRMSCAEFIASGEIFMATRSRTPKPWEVPLFFMERFCACILCARANYDVELATDGPWTQPPYRCRVTVLGVVVAVAFNSNKDIVRSIAAEEASLTLCAPLYWETLRALSFAPPRVLKPQITDPAVVRTLRVDDERVFDLDQCVSRSPAMMVQECVIRLWGQTMPTYEVREVLQEVKGAGRRPVLCYEQTLTIGGEVFTAIDRHPKRAKQRTALMLLRKAHPRVVLWQQMTELYPVLGDKRLSAMASRSQAAEAILASDRMTPYGLNARRADEKRAARAVADTTRFSSTADAQLLQQARSESASATTDGTDEGGVADEGEHQPRVRARVGERVVPGAGSNFAYAWQRQFDLEQARRQSLSEGAKIENDTLFAFKFDQDREKMDAAKLVDLKSVVCELDELAPTERERANEPISLGSQRSQGYEMQGGGTECSSDGERGKRQKRGNHQFESAEEAYEWAPWRPGTRTHAKLVEIALYTAAAPTETAADEREEEGVQKPLLLATATSTYPNATPTPGLS
jgi:hypothetical protein